MMLTKGAIGNLINRYSAVLKKCSLINTFGSLTIAGMLVLGGAGVAAGSSGYDYENGLQFSSDIILNQLDASDENSSRQAIISVNGSDNNKKIVAIDTLDKKLTTNANYSAGDRLYNIAVCNGGIFTFKGTG